MRYLGHTLKQAANLFGWGSLLDFTRHLPLDSAVMRATYPEYSSFASDLKRNAILADAIDALNALQYSLVVMSGGHARKPEAYPRPGKSKAQVIGSNPIPISDFEKWYYGGDE